ncbi:hypothetical protein WJ0W_003367 [Paenibacillus melissococcoides]|uniref:Uncharacterized protein n=2 Tax=Paenibacillus TaxID=44249 RepID=A0ABN8U9H8_9BACL|nr:hypothetical protein [Bacillus cereus]GIO82582.1 hypothetical protein J6TS7_61920 [Paenibacillus dendritiformis]CAH8246131.1 hypothetical protein WJ0W_003367 [Paenibacillus melissococcoides]
MMLADTVAYGEWRSGVRAQGLLTASSSFGVKVQHGNRRRLGRMGSGERQYAPNQEQAVSGLAAIQFNFVWIPFIC